MLNYKIEIKEAVNKTIDLYLKGDKNQMQEYLYNIEEKLLYSIYAVYYCGRDGEIELSITEDIANLLYKI